MASVLSTAENLAVAPRHVVALGAPHMLAAEETDHRGYATAWCSCGFQSYTCAGHRWCSPQACAEKDVREHARIMYARAALLERSHTAQQENDDDD